MKKKISLLLIIITMLFAGSIRKEKSVNLDAEELVATSTTYGLDIKGHISKTQDAYLSSKAVTGIGLYAPQDMVIDDNNILIIADQGMSSSKVKPFIAFYNPSSKTIVFKIENEEFKTPNGVYLLNNNSLYIADKDAGKIFVYERNTDDTFSYSKSYTKPISPLYEANDFKPSKIAVDQAYNMYVVASGVSEGILQLDKDGNFLGYFATNKVNKSIKEKMQELIYDDKTLELLGSTQPPLFTNVYTDARGLVYSTTSYANAPESGYDYVKKHNTSGSNIFSNVISGNSPLDIYVAKNNVIYTADGEGYIDVYTEDGELLYYFGGKSSSDISGVFTSLISIAVDSNNHIYCLDNKKAAIHHFVPTEYCNLIFEALDLYASRNYKQSIVKWNEVLALNSMSAIAHNNLGLNYLYSQDYKTAMYHLKLASNRTAYSQAYWEVRNMWLQTNLVYVVLGLAAIIILIFALRYVKNKKGYLFSKTSPISKFNNLKFVRDSKFNLTMLKHPYDSFYYLKTNKKGSLISCIILLLVIYFIFIFNNIGKGFIYQYVAKEDVDIFALSIGFFGMVFLVSFCNYLVSSIQDGEGSLAACFKMVCVSLVPYAISMILVILLSYVATLNEVFILHLIKYVGIGLSLVLLFLGIQNVHFYTFKKTIISILLTLLLMVVIILVLLLVIILATKLYQFIEVLIKEALR